MVVEGEIGLQELEVRLTLNIPTVEGWGSEEYGEGEWEGCRRDYFRLEEDIVDLIEQGEVEVENVEDLYAGSESENITIKATVKD